jgi:hypothetical protein
MILLCHRSNLPQTLLVLALAVGPVDGARARVEATLNEGTLADRALKALEAARKADEAGDRAGCTKAIDEVREALGSQ